MEGIGGAGAVEERRRRRRRDGQRRGRPSMIGEGGTNSHVDWTHFQVRCVCYCIFSCVIDP